MEEVWWQKHSVVIQYIDFCYFSERQQQQQKHRIIKIKALFLIFTHSLSICMILCQTRGWRKIFLTSSANFSINMKKMAIARDVENCVINFYYIGLTFSALNGGAVNIFHTFSLLSFQPPCTMWKSACKLFNYLIFAFSKKWGKQPER